MLAILTGEFFWGIVIGLILSIIGGYALAVFQATSQSKMLRLMFRDFSVDCVNNIRQIIEQMNEIRTRTETIHHDFLILMEVEVGVFGRNREHLTRLPEKPREELRKFMNTCGIKRAEAVNHLAEFYKQNELANELLAQGNGPHSQRVRVEADALLVRANRSVDQLITLSQGAGSLVTELQSIR